MLTVWPPCSGFYGRWCIHSTRPVLLFEGYPRSYLARCSVNDSSLQDDGGAGRVLRRFCTFCLAIGLVGTASTTRSVADLRVVAGIGLASLTKVQPYASINDRGLIAFPGETAAGRTAFVDDHGTLTAVIAPSSGTTGSLVRGAVQINNRNQVLLLRGTFIINTDPVIEYVPIIGPIIVSSGAMDSLDFLQFWPASGGGPPESVAQAWVTRPYDVVT
jgi:hypothetical protein